MSIYGDAQKYAEESKDRAEELEGLAVAIDSVDDILWDIKSTLSDVKDGDTAEEMFDAINDAIGKINEARDRLRG